MGTRTELSRVRLPPAVNPTDPATKADLDALGSGGVALGDLYEPMLGIWPAVDAVNGPLTADAGITSSAPSFAGMTYYGWNSGRLNKQSQNWVAVPSSNGPSSNQCCQNVTTNRGNNYASTGLGFPCHSDFSFVADTAKVIIAYWQTNTGMAAQGVATSYHEVQVFAEHDDGHLKGVREMPAVWPNGSTTNQMFYRVITFKQAKSKEFRVMLSAGCWLAGVYVDTGAQMSPAPNRPVLVGCFGDSWAEGGGNVFSSFGGNGAQAGVTWPTGCSLLYSNTAIQYAIATGFACIIGHQGGTGYFGTNGSGIGIDDVTTLGFTSFCSQNQVNYFWSTFGARHPIAGVFGMWNDGTGYSTAVYKARAITVYQKLIAKDDTIPILVEGCQNKSVTVGDGRDLANTGLKQACAQLSSNVIGFVDNIGDALSGSTIVDLGAANIGPDGLHPTTKGGNFIGVNRAKRSAGFQIPRARVLATLAA